MKNISVKSLKVDWFFLIFSIAVYCLGVLSINPVISTWHFSRFSLGIMFFLLVYLLQSYTNSLLNQTVVNEISLRFGKGKLKPQDYIFAFILLFGIFLCFYFLLKQQVLIGINLIWIGLISFFLFVQNINLPGIGIKPLEWFFKSLIISPLMFLFAISLQAYSLDGLKCLLSAVLFFLFCTSFIAFEFPKVHQSHQENTQSIIPIIGLDNTISLHNILIFLTYIGLGAFLYFSGSFRTHWSLLLVVVISLIQMFLLQRLSLGMKPNFNLLKSTAIIQVLTFIYIFILKLFI